MAQPPSVGTFSIFAAGAGNPPTSAFEYKGGWSLGKRNVILDTAGTRGTRSHPSERTRTGVYTCSGQIVMEPGPADLDFWLPYIMGNNGLLLTDQLSSFYIGIYRVAASYLYTGCVIDHATFSCTQGSLLEMSLGVEATTETAGAISGLTGLTPSKAVPFVMMDAALTIASTTYQFRQCSLTVNNHVKKDRFMNSIARTDLPALDRTVSLTLDLPFTNDTIPGLYDLGNANKSCVLTFTNGSKVLTFTMAAVQFPTEPANMPAKDEITLPLMGVARGTGSTLELVVTNV